MKRLPTRLQAPLEALIHGRLHDPHSLLGLHAAGKDYQIRVFAPHSHTVEVQLENGWHALQREHPAGFFIWQGSKRPDDHYLLRFHEAHRVFEQEDSYSYPPQISEFDLYLFNEGRSQQAYRILGAQPAVINGTSGVQFAVWAPNADRVSVVGEFNHWDGRVNPMRSLGGSGVWELFIPRLSAGLLYKFEIRNRHNGNLLLKGDPYAREWEMRPGTASRISASSSHTWQDAGWLTQRANHDWLHAPMNIYEMHAGSWKRHPDGRFYNWQELAEALIPYVQDMGFTHIELLPVSEHPLDESWGYQSTGYFAPTSRYGSPDQFRAFVDACHQAGIGVILDWVPAHFPRDGFALAYFDGTALYEHEDPRLGMHQDWGTHIFNFGRNEIKSFLISSAHYWLSEFHLDGLRVDAVASMLYLDYSRKQGEWLPNKFGGRENLEAIDFLRELNVMVHESFPGALTLAEESTAWPMVSRPTYLGGLGFSMKWNMGWMNDSLHYFELDPVYRRYHHNHLTFGQLYSYSENFILPFSHDEVVHGKHSLLDKMPGDAWQKFANLRLLLTYQMTYPGKKLNFMGNELAQGREWSVNRELDWGLLQTNWHRGVQAALRDLNHLYRNQPALHDLDFESQGFAWIDCHDADQSVLSYMRKARDGSFLVISLNFTPIPRHGYRIGVPQAGVYNELFNSDSVFYAGSNKGNNKLNSISSSWMGYPHMLELTLPPLGGIILQLQRN